MTRSVVPYRHVGLTLMLLSAVVWCSALAETYEVGVDAIDTAAGRLEISPIDSREPHLGNRIAVDGKKILETGRYLSIRATYPDVPRSKFVLLESNTGGVGCPFFFRVLEIKDDKKFALTEEFGNCGDLAKPSFYKVKENPAFKDGVWDIALETRLSERAEKRLRAQTQIVRSEGRIEVRRPKELPNDLKGEVEWYQYNDGKITQSGKPVASSVKDPEWEWRKKLEHAIPDPNERNSLIKKHGSASEAYRAWLMDEASRKVHPEQFR